MFCGFWYIQCCVIITTNSRAFSSLQKETLDPLAITPHSPSCHPYLENPMDGGAWWATVANSQTLLSDWHTCTQSILSLWICLFRIFHINGIIHDVAFHVRLLSLSIMSSSFIYVVGWVRTSFLSMAKWYSIVWTYAFCLPIYVLMDIWVASFFYCMSNTFPDSSVGKESACNTGYPGSIPGWDDLLEKG